MFESRMWEQIRIVIILSCEQYTEIVMDECPQVASACQTVWIHVSYLEKFKNPIYRLMNCNFGGLISRGHPMQWPM